MRFLAAVLPQVDKVILNGRLDVNGGDPRTLVASLVNIASRHIERFPFRDLALHVVASLVDIWGHHVERLLTTPFGYSRFQM